MEPDSPTPIYPMSRLLSVAVLSLGFALLAGGCANLEADKTANWTVEHFLAEGRSKLQDGKWEEAITTYQKLLGRYPFGSHAEQAQLDIAYAYYKNGERPLAVATADRFIQMHPTHPRVDYAYYLKGLAGFQPPSGIFSRITGDSPSERDISPVREAFDAYRELINRFPDSHYASDARERLVHIINVLAMHEVNIARYYYSRGAFVAAVNRAKRVLEIYQSSAVVEHALGVMLDAYRKMGFADLRADTARVLKLNYPGSRYLN